jgi:hypothetical protein
MTGDLVIEATGVVTFNGPLTLADGGRLVVRGGGSVVFASTADLGAATTLLEVSGISATGGAGSIRGQGVLQVQGTTPGGAIDIGAGMLVTTPGALRVGDDVLRAIGAGFTAVRIGSSASAAAGAVTIGGSDFSITGSPVEALGSGVTVWGTGAGLRYGTSLTLHAAGSVQVNGLVVGSRTADIALISDTGAVAVTTGASISSNGGDIRADGAAGVMVATLDARAADGTAGTVRLRSTGGVISDFSGAEGVNIRAFSVEMAGVGPALGSGMVLEVAAQLVRVDVPDAVVLRESGTDGRVYFNVLRGSQMVQALVSSGPVSRITTDTDAFTAGGGLQQLAAGAGARSTALSANVSAASTAAMASATNTGVQAYLSKAFTESAYSGMALSQRLLAESDLSFASGQSAAVAGPQVDYWSETLSL